MFEVFLLSLLACASPEPFTFLSVTNVTNLERLHRASSRAIIGYFWLFLISLYLSQASLSPLRVTLTHFAMFSYERDLRISISFPISGLARLGVKPRLSKSHGKSFRPLTRSCFVLLLLGKFSLLALLLLLGSHFPLGWS